jgi:glyoxylase-like metal-dependent hydrolase (beta-lactamase superfamily II)
MGDGIDVEEAVDRDFVPDISLADGDVAASGDGWTLTAVHTPGHAANHVCFALDAESALFTGDHVMGWSTTVIAPPDGNMAEYVASLRLVAARHDSTLLPTHGAPVREPTSFVEALIDHRLAREQAVIDAVADGLHTIDQIVARLYADVRPELHKPAGFSVLAHLESLVADGLVVTDGRPRRRGEFRVAR